MPALRAAGYLGIVREPSPGLFALTDLGERLRPGAPGALHDLALMTGDAFFSWWGRLEQTVRTGESSVPAIEGVSSFEYLHRHPEQTQRFNRMMSEMIGAMANGVLSAYDFSRFKTVVDIGGGRGTLLAAILESHPRVHGVLFDLLTADGLTRRWPRAVSEDAAVRGRRRLASVPSGDCILLSAVSATGTTRRAWRSSRTAAARPPGDCC
jgi:hypothetical protein